MSDGTALYLVLWALHLSECGAWIGRRAVLFAWGWSGRGRASLASDHFGNDHGALALLNPLPPNRLVFRTEAPAVAAAPQGVCSATLRTLGNEGRPAGPVVVHPYEALAAVQADGKRVLVNGVPFVATSSEACAEGLADGLRRLAEASPEDRPALLDRLTAERFDVVAAEARLQQTRALTASLCKTGDALFVVLYVVAPLLALAVPLVYLLIPVALTMLVFAFMAGRFYRRGHRQLFATKRFERWAESTKTMLCPPGAIRMGSVLSYDALVAWHPLAVGHLLGAENYTGFAARYVRDLRHPLDLGLGPDAQAIAEWAAARELLACERFLTEHHPAALDVVDEPPEWDGASTSFCPRCHVQYLRDAGDCPDCDGVALRPHPAAARDA